MPKLPYDDKTKAQVWFCDCDSRAEGKYIQQGSLVEPTKDCTGWACQRLRCGIGFPWDNSDRAPSVELCGMRDGASTAVPTASTAVAVWLMYVDDKGVAYPAQEHNKNARTDTPTDLLENYNQGQDGDLNLTIPKVWWQFQDGPVAIHGNRGDHTIPAVVQLLCGSAS